MAGVPFNALAAAQPEAPAQSVTADPAVRARFLEQKAQAPGAAGLTDAQFALGLHQNHYRDIPLTDFLTRIGIDRGDALYELRASDDPYGTYLRQALATPGTGETKQRAAERQGGSLEDRRAGDVEGAIRAALQGATFGFGDEIVGAGAAALDPLVHGERGKDFGQRFDAYTNRERGLIDNFREDNPVAAYGAEIAGAIPTSAAAGGQLAGRGVNVASRIGSTFGVGAGQGAAYGAGTAEGSVEDRAKAAAAGAVAGGATSLGLSAVQSALNSAIRSGASKVVQNTAPTADAIRQQSRAGYQAADNSGAALIPQATTSLSKWLQQGVAKQGVILPNGNWAPGYGRLRAALKQLDAYSAAPMDMRAFQRFEEALQHASRSDKPGQANLARTMLGQLDDFIEAMPSQAYTGGDGPNAAKAWLTAKADWARHKRTKALEDAFYGARMTGSGNFAGNLRSQIGQILKSHRKRSRGFSDAEVAAMERFAEGGPVGSLVQAFASGGGIPAGIFGGLAGGPVGAAAGAGVNLGAKTIRDRSARQAINAIRAQVANGGQAPAPMANGSLLELQALLPGASNPLLQDQRDGLSGLMFGAN